MEEDAISFYKKKLIKSKVGWGKNRVSEARGVSKAEALKNCIEIETNPKSMPKSLFIEKINDLRIRTLTLNKPLRHGMSPFNPPLGFYVRNVQDKGCLHVELEGLKRKDSVLSLAKFIMEEAYRAHFIADPLNRYKGLILKDDKVVGKMFFVGSHNKILKIIFSEFNQRITIRFWNKGLIIKTSVVCPLSVKQKIMPKLQNMKMEYWDYQIKKHKHSGKNT